jgi:hypothetical protein
MKSCPAVHVCLCTLVAGIYNAVDAFVLRDQVRRFPPLYSQQQETKPCFYREPTTRQWKPRINIVDLYVGQQLNGTVVQELLDGKTGPKRTYYIILHWKSVHVNHVQVSSLIYILFISIFRLRSSSHQCAGGLANCQWNDANGEKCKKVSH